MNTVDQAKSALWKQSKLPHNPEGYVANVRMNLVAGVTPEIIQEDYCKGSGQEWLRKIRAIHSSAALAANTFGRWKREPAKIRILGLSGFQSLKLEAQCRTGLRGTPPNLDVLLEAPDVVIGIEAKLLEPLNKKKPHFSPSYTLANLPLCESEWWELLNQSRQWPSIHLDVAQLIKHYLGLRRQYPDGRQVYLMYLFWKPLNAASIPEYSRHAKDLQRFRNAVAKGGSVQFMSMDYLQLWESWSQDVNLAEHANLLKQRYCVEI